MIPADDPLVRVVRGEEGRPAVAPPDRADVLARGHRVLALQALAALCIVVAIAGLLIAMSVGARGPVRTRFVSSPPTPSQTPPVASFNCTQTPGTPTQT